MNKEERLVMQMSLAAMKELVAQTENRFFTLRHDHPAFQDARYAIAKMRECLAPIEIEKILEINND